MAISGRILIISVTAITAVSALFCVIGLATKAWPIFVTSGVFISPTGNLFCNGCPKTPAALSIISFLLLIATLIAFALLMFDILKGFLQYIPFVLLFIATMFLLSTFASYFYTGSSSYNLIVVAHFLSYVALAAAAYWYGQMDASSSTG